LNALPTAQRTLWPELEQVPRHFVLYGGTALALRLGHRPEPPFCRSHPTPSPFLCHVPIR
ncbi:MAG: hypothetical protein NTW03_06000, partial [Verrucomicrobia bacterium]|nr:hypothetical protein [Verrucomicrobiota bacterium]